MALVLVAAYLVQATTYVAMYVVFLRTPLKSSYTHACSI